MICQFKAKYYDIQIIRHNFFYGARLRWVKSLIFDQKTPKFAFFMPKKTQKTPKIPFSSILLKWDEKYNKREMPWKGEKNPYKIWLSEIILQQTRVEQGLNYYKKILKAYPTIQKLAKAPDDQVFKLWEGLGYYSRCRNLLATARKITDERKGKFPETYEEICELKGVGPYTAAAISSFAYNLPYAVVDGNVFRVLSRIFGIDTPIDSTEGKKFFSELAASLLDEKKPGKFNQAIMDFGATVCKPLAPACEKCPFKKKCEALATNRVMQLPIKEKDISIKSRWFYYLVIHYRDKMIVGQRTSKDIWQDLFEFPLLELDKTQAPDKLLSLAIKKKWFNAKEFELLGVSPLFKQQLSHQLIAGQFISVKLKKKPTLPEGWQLVDANQIKKLAFPQFINQFLTEKVSQQAMF